MAEVIQLNWVKCPCGAATCSRMYPEGFGTFYAGCGFEPAERALLDWAFITIQAMYPDEFRSRFKYALRAKPFSQPEKE